MSQRYLISEADLQRLKLFSNMAKFDMVHKEITKIIDKRFVGTSTQPIRSDVRKVAKFINEEECQKI